jgi:hypothetical protein
MYPEEKVSGNGGLIDNIVKYSAFTSFCCTFTPMEKFETLMLQRN